jgi:hypothetical protein
MSPDDATARNRYFLIALARIVPSLGAVLGVVLLARAPDFTTRLLGFTIVLAALSVMATLPRALVQRWKTPPLP